MPRGGARVNSGPPPDPNALRRDRPSDKDGWTTLPAEGRKGKIPDWPLPADVNLSAARQVADDKREQLSATLEVVTSADAVARIVSQIARLDQRIAELDRRLEAAVAMEAELWGQLWRTPQAVMWERLKWTREVALYVRWQVLAELGELKAGQEARQLSDRLGINPAAMQRNRWRIAPSEPAAKKRGGKVVEMNSVKDRLKVVPGGGGKT